MSFFLSAIRKIQKAVNLKSTTGDDSVEITVYEDTDGDGKPENQETFSIDGGTETLQPSKLNLLSGYQIWWKIETQQGGDITDTNKFEKIEIETPDKNTKIETVTELNGSTTEIKFFEDTDGDGKPENTDKFTLQGGTETFEPSQINLEAGNTFWWKITTQDTDTTNTPKIQKIRLLN